ncbi:MAG: zinc-dependent alcohol dehydrogenase [Anaerolineae bacterium]
MDIPTPGPLQVLLKVEAVNTCPHWDMHIFEGKPMFDPNVPIKYPYQVGQPGHEATGVIAAVGEGVQGLQVGQRASAWRDQGHERWGCYAQYVILEADNAIAVPESLSLLQTASIELAMCISTTILDLKHADVLRGKRVGIGGLGPAGLVAAQLAKAEGASEVIGFEVSPVRRAFAADFMDRVVDSTGDEGAAFPKRNQPGALDVSIDCVGARAVAQYLMDHTREVVAFFGVQREDFTFRHGSLKLFGYLGHYRTSAEYALARITDGSLDLASLSSRQLPLEAYAEGTALLQAQQALKITYLPWQ